MKSICIANKNVYLISAVILSFLLKCSDLFAQPQLQWFNYPGGVSIALDEFEHVYTANWDYNPGGDITLTKRDSSGNILWEVPFTNVDNTRHEVATWVETDHDNNVLVSGTIRSGFSSPANVNGILMKYDDNGDLIWRVNTGADFDGSYTVKCLVDLNNNIYVLALGNTDSGLITQLRKYDPDGQLLWTYNDENGIGAPQNLKLTPDNALIIIGRNTTGNYNGVAKIDENGSLIWSEIGIPSLTAGDATGDSAGNTYIVHGTSVVGQHSTILEKRSTTGQVIWQMNHSMTAFRVELGPDQMPIISGFPGLNQGGVAFAKFDETGMLVWENNDADGALYALLSHSMMKIDADGSAYVAGSTMSQMALCKINSDGSSAFTIESPSGYPVDFELGNDQSIYLVGGTTSKFKTQDLITALPENSERSEEIKLFPNPSSKMFTIVNSSGKELFFYITDLRNCVVVPVTQVDENEEFVFANNLKAGMYLVHFSTNVNSVTKVKKIIVH